MLVRAGISVTILFNALDVFGELYTVFNATDKFFEYKEKYNKEYNSTNDEQNHYLTFIKNLNAAAALNETSSDTTIYVINKYADLDPADVKQRYAINLKTYNKVENGDSQELRRSDQGIEINDDNLNDINNAEEIFEKYIEEEKRNITKKRNNFVHFYRFVRALVEKNKGAYEHTDAIPLLYVDRRGILNKSNEFFY